MTKAEKFMSDAPCHYKADEACAWAAGYNACLADVPQSSVGALEALANMFSESVHETWRKEEIVNIIEDAIRLGSPHTRPLRHGENK